MVLSHYPLNELSTDPIAFHDFLKGIFMENGSAIIEREIARRLLDGVANGRVGRGGLHLGWLAAATSTPKGPGRALAKEKKILRQFVALATLPRGHQTAANLVPIEGTSRASSIELTSLRFADAFKKGS